jgi:hypothetical protein
MTEKVLTVLFGMFVFYLLSCLVLGLIFSGALGAIL